MRFHIGFSFGWKEIKKLIIPILIAVAVFFGLKEVNALEISFTSSNVSVVFSECDGDYNSCVNYKSSVYSVPTNNQIILKYPEFSIQNSPYSYMSISKYSGISAINFEVNGLNLVANNQYRVKVNMSFSSTNGIRRIFNQNQIVDFTTNGTTAKNYTYKSNDNNSFYIYFTPAVNSTKIYFSMYSLMSGSGSENEFLIYNKGICDSISFSNGCSNNFNNITMNFTSPTVELVSEDPIQGGLNDLDNSISNQTTIIQGNQQETMGKLDELKDKFEDMFNSCITNYFPLNYSFTSGTVSNGLTLTINSDKSITINGTSSKAQFINIATTNLFTNDLNYGGCSNGYCLSEPFGYTFSNKIIWRYYGSGAVVNETLRPLILKEGESISGYIAPGSKQCKNKIDSTNDKLNDLENTITDDDVDLGSGDSFFNGFTVEDNGGISAIVKAPLRMFQSLVNGNNQCQALSFPIMGTEVTLPSGCILWDNVPDNVVTLWHVIILGLASYRILIDLFRIIENLKEPDNDKVEVTDL